MDKIHFFDLMNQLKFAGGIDPKSKISIVLLLQILQIIISLYIIIIFFLYLNVN